MPRVRLSVLPLALVLVSGSGLLSLLLQADRLRHSTLLKRNWYRP
jgi:hypothetical protein